MYSPTQTPIKSLPAPAKFSKHALTSQQTDQLYTDLFKSQIVKNRHVLNRSKTDIEFSLNSFSSSSNSDSGSKLSPKQATTSSISLNPLFPTYTDALTDSLKKLNSSQKPPKNKKPIDLHRSRSKTKKKFSSSLSIMDYSNIINMNTNHQMLIDFIETSRRESNTAATANLTKKPHGRGHKSLTASTNGQTKQEQPIQQMFLNTYIQRQAMLSEQMASLFGSSMCACNLCRMKTVDSKRMLQHNYEITPLADNFDYTIIKYTYSSPISELSTLKFFNLMNTDCSIFFNETNKTSIPPNTISNNTAMLPFGSTDNLPVNNSIKVANNSPPLYDSRYMYLIDCRLNKSDYGKSRIFTAIHYTDLLNDNVYLSPPCDNHTLIVLYDHDGTFLTSSFNKFKASPASTVEQLPSDTIINAVRTKLNCNQSKTIYILSGGYNEFFSKYPFMSTDLHVRSAVDRNKYLTIYPNCVIDKQLYIGSAIQAKNWKIIRELNITHVINASFEHECVFKDELKYLHVEVEDSHEEKINKTFKRALEFMNLAFEEYREALIKDTSDFSVVVVPTPPVFFIHCNLGISRSSSILIAYMICKYRLCLYAAFNYVKDKRLQIAPNYSFLRQLKEFEEHLF